MSLVERDLGQLPKPVHNGCCVIFARQILEEISTPDTWANKPLKIDPEDAEVMASYYTLARDILKKYKPRNTFGPGPYHPITQAIRADILANDYRMMAYHFHDTFAFTSERRAPKELREFMVTGIAKEDPVDNDGCADDCCHMEAVVNPIFLMQYRWELSQLADYIVFKFELPPPGGKPCLVWSSEEWKQWYQMSEAEYRENHAMFNMLNHAGLIRNIESQGHGFSQQFICYIASAITQAGLQHGSGQKQTIGVCSQIINLLEELIVTERMRARSWLKNDPVISMQLQDCWTLMGIQHLEDEA